MGAYFPLFGFLILRSTPLLSHRDVNQLLAEQVRSLNEKFSLVAKTLYKNEELVKKLERETPKESKGPFSNITPMLTQAR